MTSNSDEVPKVFLCMPHGPGGVSFEAVGAFYDPRSPSAGLVAITGLGDCSSSAAPDTMNHLLCQALGARDAGVVTHFAMIHADVDPAAHWLDTLWLEMRRTGADAIAAVIAIKEKGGRTSTAVGKVDDPWAGGRCLHVSERQKLPVTFTAADCCGEGEVLLINNGLYLADLRHPAWDSFPGFDTSTRIAPTRALDGARRSEMRSEDWECARHLAANGATVAATWAVRVEHHGGGKWVNR